ncbi:MAG: DUF1902 domain-containing protein [Eubacteriaceae bacterium]|jgi:hypothetical protein|nr:DUF1902 domain-containing protein [Eubacteriaceae bacterium]
MEAKNGKAFRGYYWGQRSGVVAATSKSVVGLALEPRSLDALKERVRNTIPELLELNGAMPAEASFAHFRCECREQIAP